MLLNILFATLNILQIVRMRLPVRLRLLLFVFLRQIVIYNSVREQVDVMGLVVLQPLLMKKVT